MNQLNASINTINPNVKFCLCSPTDRSPTFFGPHEDGVGRLRRTEQHPRRLAAAQRALRRRAALAAEDATTGAGDATTDDGQILEGAGNDGKP